MREAINQMLQSFQHTLATHYPWQPFLIQPLFFSGKSCKICNIRRLIQTNVSITFLVFKRDVDFLSRLTSTQSVSGLYIVKIILIISSFFRMEIFLKYIHHISYVCSICMTKVYKQSRVLEESWSILSRLHD